MSRFTLVEKQLSFIKKIEMGNDWFDCKILITTICLIKKEKFYVRKGYITINLVMLQRISWQAASYIPEMITPSTWWRHPMEAFSTLLAFCAGNSPVTGEFPAQRPITRSFYIFFDLRLNKRLNKKSKRRWFETPSRSLWPHRNEKADDISWDAIKLAL